MCLALPGTARLALDPSQVEPGVGAVQVVVRAQMRPGGGQVRSEHLGGQVGAKDGVPPRRPGTTEGQAPKAGGESPVCPGDRSQFTRSSEPRYRECLGGQAQRTESSEPGKMLNLGAAANFGTTRTEAYLGSSACSSLESLTTFPHGAVFSLYHAVVWPVARIGHLARSPHIRRCSPVQCKLSQSGQ